MAKQLVIVLALCFALNIEAGFIFKRDAPHALAALTAGHPANTYLPARLQSQNDNSVSSDSDTESVSDTSSEDNGESVQVASAPLKDESSSAQTELTDDDDTESHSGAAQTSNTVSGSLSGRYNAPQITNDYLPPSTNYGTPVVANQHHASVSSSGSGSGSVVSSSTSAATNGNGHSSGVSQKYDSNGGYLY